MELSICPFRSQFTHPFGTAHGVRTGTDALFIRLVSNDKIGYGEIALPPYLKIDRNNILDEIKSVGYQWLDHVNKNDLQIGPLGPGPDISSPLSAGLSMAYYDLISKMNDIPIHKLLQVPENSTAKAMATVGIGDPEEIESKLASLPNTPVLKVKVGGTDDLQTIRKIKQMDSRKLFLDANQGMPSVEAMIRLVDEVGSERLAGIEQPFPVVRLDLQRELIREISVPVYADESFQGAADMDLIQGSFTGVNLKLMKCGGLESTAALARTARQAGLLVMLGSMSESTLGSGAMAHLGGLADLGDLDGPWLLQNDPFEGMELRNGCYQVTENEGIGVRLKAELDWRPIGA